MMGLLTSRKTAGLIALRASRLKAAETEMTKASRLKAAVDTTSSLQSSCALVGLISK